MVIPKMLVQGIYRKTLDNEPDLAGAGTASAPAFSFTDDTDTGMFLTNHDSMGFSTGGSQGLSVSSSAASSTVATVIPAGTAAAPAVTFNTTDTNTGLYWVGANNLGISAGGTKRFDVSTTATTSTNNLVLPLGSTSTPSFRVSSSDPDSGIYSTTGTDVSFSVGEIPVMSVTSTHETMGVPIKCSANPMFAFTSGTTTGLGSNGNQIVVLANNTVPLSWVKSGAASTRVYGGVPFNAPYGTESAPSFTFTGDTTSGLYYDYGTSSLGFAVSGDNALTIGSTASTSSVPVSFKSYTVAGKPSAATAGQVIYISNDAGTPNKIMAFSDGTSWRRMDTGAVLS